MSITEFVWLLHIIVVVIVPVLAWQKGYGKRGIVVWALVGLVFGIFAAIVISFLPHRKPNRLSTR